MTNVDDVLQANAALLRAARAVCKAVREGAAHTELTALLKAEELAAARLQAALNVAHSDCAVDDRRNNK